MDRSYLKFLLAVILAFVMSGILTAQGDKSKDEWRKLKIENEHVRVVEVTLQPGQKTPAHTHPTHFLYVINGGKLEVKFDDGEVQNWDLPDGEFMWSEPERSHVSTNTGNKPLKFLLVEFVDMK